MTEQSIDDFRADRFDEDLAVIAVKYLGEDAGLGAITAWVTLHKAAPDLLAALERNTQYIILALMDARDNKGGNAKLAEADLEMNRAAIAKARNQ